MDTGTDTGDTSVAETLDQIGALTLGDWLWALGLVVIAIIGAIVVRRLATRLFENALGYDAARLLGRLGAVVVFGIGVIYALGQVGVSVAPLLGILGLAGLALAFAFQEVLENYVAGVFMALRRPFGHGDEIQTGDHEGVVEEIALRAVTMRTFDGRRLYVPNAEVWRNPILNNTELGSRRTTLTVGVSYDADLEKAGQLLVETLSQTEGVYADPAPQAYAYEFADSSINFALRFWHDPAIADLWRVRDAATKSVKRALDDAGIEIPFPQRVVGFVGEPSPVAS